MGRSLIREHQAFWDNTPGVVLRSQLDFSREPFRKRIYTENIKGPFSIESLDIDWLVQAYKKAFQDRPAFNGDLVEFIQFAYVVPWMEGIIGCLIYSLGRGASMVANPPDGEPAELSEHLKRVLDELETNPWLIKLNDGIETVARAFKNEYPVVQTLLRGPGDMLGAIMGYEKLVAYMLDSSCSDYLHELLDLCCSIWIEVANMHHKAAGTFKEGYCNAFGLWTPGIPARFQEDIASLLSPALYTEFLLPCGIRLADAFEYSSIHMHSGYVQTVYDWRNLSDQSAIKALQISLDPMGPAIEELMKTMLEMNARRPLIIRATKKEFPAQIEKHVSEFPGSIVITAVDNDSLRN
jgi:hypothetical protein